MHETFTSSVLPKLESYMLHNESLMLLSSIVFLCITKVPAPNSMLSLPEGT